MSSISSLSTLNHVDNKRNSVVLIGGITIAFLFYPLIGRVIFSWQETSVAKLFCTRLFIWLEVLVLFYYARKIEGSHFLLWRDRVHRFSFYIFSAGALYLLAMACGLLSKTPQLFGIHDNRILMKVMLVLVNKNMALLLFSCVTAGFTEELIFRGYLVPRLQLLFKNQYMPVIVSALMFAIVHFSYNSINELVYTFLIGVIFAIHYLRYRNIKSLIVFHALLDLSAFLIYRYHPVNLN